MKECNLNLVNNDFNDFLDLFEINRTFSNQNLLNLKGVRITTIYTMMMKIFCLEYINKARISTRP